MSTNPSRNDSRNDKATTRRCPVCGRSFTPQGRRRYCDDKCRQQAFRRRHQPGAAKSRCRARAPSGRSPPTSATVAAKGP